jgi:hypothetical protein
VPNHCLEIVGMAFHGGGSSRAIAGSRNVFIIYIKFNNCSRSFDKISFKNYINISS